MRFRDRREAGRLLADRLTDLRAGEPVVLAISTGGVMVASTTGSRLLATLDVLLVERLRAPEDADLTLGAAAEDGSMNLADHAAAVVGISAGELRAMGGDAVERTARRGRVCRRGRPVTDLQGRLVIIVDDHAIAGHPLFTAVDAVKAHGSSHVHIAVPTVSRWVVAALRERVARVGRRGLWAVHGGGGMMSNPGLLFVLGGVLLVGGAELLVRGASRLAVAAGITPLVVGLTVVAFGTSAPEMAVTVGSAYVGQAELTLWGVAPWCDRVRRRGG